MKVKSVSDLAFRAIDEITDDEDELWVAHIVFDGQAARTGDIQRIMKQDCGVPYYAVQLILKKLVEKGIIIRKHLGFYEPNVEMLLPKMIEILEAGVPNLPRPDGQTDKAREEKTQNHRGG